MGLLDSIAYGLAGGAAGGADAAQPALGELQKGELAKELNQQTSDLRVQAEQQIEQNRVTAAHAEQGRQGAIYTNAVTAAGAQYDAMHPAAGAPAAPVSAPAAPVSAPAATPPPGPGDNGLSAPAPGVSPAAAPGGAAPGPLAAAGAPTPAPTAPSGGFARDAYIAGKGREALNSAGLFGQAADLAKQDEFNVTGGGYFGDKVVFNKNNGQWERIGDASEGRANSGVEIARIRAGATAAAHGNIDTLIEKSGPPPDWATPDPMGQKPPVPDPTIGFEYKQRAHYYAEQGMDANAAVMHAGNDIHALAGSADALAQKNMPDADPQSPQFKAYRSQVFASKLDHLYHPSATAAPGGGGTTALPANKGPLAAAGAPTPGAPTPGAPTPDTQSKPVIAPEVKQRGNGEYFMTAKDQNGIATERTVPAWAKAHLDLIRAGKEDPSKLPKDVQDDLQPYLQ